MASKATRRAHELASRYGLEVVAGRGSHLKLMWGGHVVAVLPAGRDSEYGTALRKTEAQIRRFLREHGIGNCAS